ncbi:MAG: DNA gyrase subunit B [Candidatus Azosocius agrarius]|nr:MAG: DNA gyrase subunit B [Gammaproteobacteria bacterium]
MTVYNSSNIKVLKGLEGVKKRPGMYIGNTGDNTGLHRLIFEIVDNSMDEALVGHCNVIDIVINSNNSVTIKDNGRGIPVEFHIFEEKTAVEVIMTTLHSGAKFDNNVYKISSGLHGVGVSVVNALSEYMYVCIYKNGYIYRQDYKYGYNFSELLKISKTYNRGTLICFKPNLFYFNSICFNYNILDQRFRELSFLNSGIKINLKNNRLKKKENVYLFTGGIKSFVEQLNLKKDNINDILHFKEIKNGIYVECALQWVKAYSENIFCYANNIRQKDGGSHMAGFKSALTKAFNVYMNNFIFLKKNKVHIIGEDIREGFVGVLSVKLSDPKFSSQTKEKLVSSEVKFVVDSIVFKNLYNYLLEQSIISKIICNKILEAVKVREAAKKTKDTIRKKDFLELNKLYSRLAGCQIKDPVFSELYLVEGDSAGGSAKQARDRYNQAVLPLKGKILNVEKASIDKLLSSVEINLLISVLGCGVGDTDYNFVKLKYRTIIIMTDADVDGLHIRTLLLTFFYRYMKDLILRGCIYIAQPPLYRIKKGKEGLYFNDFNDLNNYFFDNFFINVKIFSIKTLKVLSKEEIKDIVFIYKNISVIINELLNKYPKELLDVFFFVFKLNDEDFTCISVLEKWKHLAQEYFNNYYKNSNLYFMVEFNCNYIKISLYQNAILNDYFFYKEFFSSERYNDLYFLIIKINYLFNDNFYIEKGKVLYKLINFSKTMEWIENEAKVGFSIQRYKGLGEMNSDQLWETTMNPRNRKIIKINLQDCKKIDEVILMLMGNDIKNRKNYIDNNALYAKNIDF